MKRSPIKRKAKRNPIPQSVLRAVEERSGGRCEYSGKDYDLDNAHIIHRGMGGSQGTRAKMINDPRNIVKLNRFYHDVLDGRARLPELKNDILQTIRIKTGWYGWETEYRDSIHR